MPSLYAKKATDIIRVLLVNYPKIWTLRDLAKEASVSLGQTAKISQTLIDERLALRASAKSSLKLIAPMDILKRWATINTFKANTKFIDYYTNEEDVSKFLDKLKGKKGPEYAITGLAGALLTAPFVRPTNVHIYVNNDDDAETWAGLLGLMPVEENGNVKFAIPRSKGVFYGAREINGVKVVSDVQLYVDLLNYPARGEEAAGEIYKAIEKRWKQAGIA